MKEIWKLIELLNEYEKKELKSEFYEWEKWIWWDTNLFRRNTRDEEWSHIYSTTADTYVISKKYGFIWWLVENNKIDFDKCWLDVRHYLSYNERYDKWIVMAENYDNDTLVREFYSPYKQLLMLLSISDTPIEDLISYLK